jgi:PAS domain S-box-containing protein
MRSALDVNNPLYEVQFRYRHGQGHWVWFHSRGRIMERGPDGTPLITAGISTDISQLKRTEEQLAASEIRFSELVEHIPVGVYTFVGNSADGSRKFTYVNDRLAQMMGVHRADLLRDASLAFNAAIPEDRDRLLQLNHEALLTGKPFHFEGRFHVGDDVRWFSINSRRSFHSGAESRWDGIVTDITERKLAEDVIRTLNVQLEQKVAARTAELEASDNRLRHALDAANAGVWEWNLQTGHICDIRSSSPLLQHCPEGQDAFSLFDELIHPDDRQAFRAASKRLAKESGDFEMEYRLRFGDDRYHWVLARGQVVESNGEGVPLRAIGTFTDIEFRKQIELQNRKLAAIVEASCDLIGTTSPEGKVDYLNPAFRSQLGYGKELPADRFQISTFHPESMYREIIEEGIPCAIKEGAWQGDTVLLRQDGSELEVSQSILAPKNPQTGEVEFLATICRDITDRKRLEQEIRDRNDALEKADRRKTEFLAMLAHELRNPLTPMLMVAQLLKDGRLDQAQQDWSFNVIERQTKHLAKLVDDLLDVSRISEGKINLDLKRVDLNGLLEEAIEMCRPHIEAAHHQLSVHLPPEPVSVEGDPVRLVQVVSNLLNNAAKFTPPNRQLWLTLEKGHDQAVITVGDNGMGIDPSRMEHVFGLFDQVEHSTNTNNGGLGIGLYLSRTLLQMQGGTIEATSQGPDKGCEFVVRLPLVQAAQNPAQSADTGREQAKVASMKILVADDNVDGANSLRLLFQHNGHQVRMAHDGRAALEQAKDFQPELILLDIGMPGMDGYEVCRQIRSQDWGQKITLVALTGWGQSTDKQQAYEAGFDHHLTKPVKIGELEALLQNQNWRGRQN